ncbi:MAG: phage tail sheath subtilisin-like domain-containing protein [Clostridiales bacterium]|nr:phage tail sheath subtilisin-like domain-containing protein [Clostridiales bacterium]
MSAFNVVERAPGVYMQEEDMPGPIPGVSTGVAAIVGPALSGPINTPLFVTNWTQFTEVFGGYSYDTPVYATHAVRGFFENGGSRCCFVRVGTARCASLAVTDSSAKGYPVFIVTARNEGKQGNGIKVETAQAHLCETTAVQCSAVAEGLSTDQLKLTMKDEDDAKLFCAGDELRVSQGIISEEAQVAMVAGVTVILKTALLGKFGGGGINVRLDDPQGKKRLRLDNTDKLEPGSYLEISQEADGEDIKVFGLVESLDGQTVLLRSALQGAFSLKDGAEDIYVKSLEFSLKMAQGTKEDEYKGLSTVPYHSRYYEKVIGDGGSVPVFITPADPPNPSQPPDNLPDPTFIGTLTGGVNDSLGGITPQDYKDAITALEKVRVNIVCVPDASSFDPNDPIVQLALLEHCASMGDRFAVLDCAANLSVGSAIDQRKRFGSSSYGAVYYPWIEIPHPLGQGRVKVPPSGHIAGVYARTDDKKGVHKAPANEVINGSLGPVSILNHTEHGLLNESGVNAIVNVPGNGVTIMGGRTLTDSSQTQWRYINVRRLLLYVENSIQEATRFAVFLPNNPSLWATVKRQVSDFLTGVWRDGALFGATPGDAFKVKVDEELNPPSVRALGKLTIEVVLYPVTPAEFVIFRVIQQPGGPSISE